jgi:hypothetical protein
MLNLSLVIGYVSVIRVVQVVQHCLAIDKRFAVTLYRKGT